jgi:prepilin peptidase CpaA
MTVLSLSQFLTLLYAALLLCAAVQDVLTYRIANMFSLAIAAVCAAAIFQGTDSNWWPHLISFTIALALGILLYAVRWMGGGDAKLIAAAALAFNLTGLLVFLAATAMIGGLVAMGSVIAGLLLPAPSTGKSRREVPYGVAIAAGAIATAFIFPAYSTFKP